MSEKPRGRKDEIVAPEPRKRWKGWRSLAVAAFAFVAVAVLSSYFLRGVAKEQAARRIEAGQRRSSTPETLRASVPRKPLEPEPAETPLAASDERRARRRAEAREAYRQALAAPYRKRGSRASRTAAPVGRNEIPRPPAAAELGTVLGELLRANALGAPPAAAEAPAAPRRSDAVAPVVPGSPVLQAGAHIEAVLVQRVNSQTPGPVRAQVTRNIYDSLTGRVLLIPQGSRLVGEQGRTVQLGDQRIPIRWTRLQLPDGSAIGLPDAPAASKDGTVGVQARVRNRWGLRLGASGALALVTAAVQVSQPERGGELSAREIAAAEVGLGYGRLGEELARRLLDLPPRLTLEAGELVRVVLTEDLLFPTA